MRKKTYFTIFLITTMSYLAPAEEPVHFADDNLKTAVEQALGVNDPTQTDMLALTWLYAHDLRISDLTGLEHAKNIEGLYLFDNQISDISALAELMNLDYLYLRNNPLNQEAYDIFIPKIRENNPDINISL